jgi:energy-coupling factor transport system substrate-specific component
VSRFRPSLEDAALIAITLGGLSIFLAPLFANGRFPGSAALFTALIACSAVVVVAVALQTHRLSTRLLAVLAALVAIDATLRLVIVIGLLGFSPIFFLIILGGFVMGPGFGFALGALTLLLSAVLTAGFGPWLPYQMLAAGWVGMGAGFVGRADPGRRRLWTLATYGAIAGFAYGVLLDLWEWPFLLGSGASPISWAPGLGLAALGRRFALFYLTTSLVYDVFRAAGNLVLISLLGRPVALALDRFRRRFLVDWMDAGPAISPTATNISGNVRTPA